MYLLYLLIDFYLKRQHCQMIHTMHSKSNFIKYFSSVYLLPLIRLYDGLLLYLTFEWLDFDSNLFSISIWIYLIVKLPVDISEGDLDSIHYHRNQSNFVCH